MRRARALAPLALALAIAPAAAAPPPPGLFPRRVPMPTTLAMRVEPPPAPPARYASWWFRSRFRSSS